MSGKPWYNNGQIEIQIGPNDKIPDGFVRGRKPLSPEEQSNKTAKFLTTYNSKTDDEKAEIAMKKSTAGIKYWNSLSDEEKQKLIDARTQGLNNMSDEKKQARNAHISQGTLGKNTGNEPWNKGLTKETSDDVAELSKKVSATNKLKAQQIKEVDPEFFNRWRHKVSDTMKVNGTYGSSKDEDDYYRYLLTQFEPDDIIRQYRDTRYPFDCDFYIKSLDLFIEINAHWTHGGHPFNPNSLDDISKLEDWEELAKTSKFYQQAIYVWTDLDVRKQKCAKDHHLNYKAIY